MPPEDRPPRPDDRVRYQHMLDAAEKAIQLTAGKAPEAMAADEVLPLALVRLVEIVGEAAWQISEEGRSRCPDLPWQQIIGMRHRIVHAYFAINYAILWKTVQQSLPALVSRIRPVVEQWSASSDS